MRLRRNRRQGNDSAFRSLTFVAFQGRQLHLCPARVGANGDGTREYIRVLRLLEKHPLARLRRAVEQALSVGAITRDAIAQFLYPRENWRATTFSLAGHPHLRQVRVAAPDLAQYRELVRGVA